VSTDESPPPAGRDVVPLSRWRALVARSRGARKRVEALLSDSAAPVTVRRLPPEDVFFLVRSLGLEDAGELLRLAAPEQLRVCLDLDLWRRDRLDVPRTIGWLEALEALGPARLAIAAEAFDLELLAFLVRRHARIYDRTLGEAPPDDTPRAVVETPDGFYWLEFGNRDRHVTALVARLLDQIYKARADLGMAIVREARWTTTSELEESAYQFRARRTADLGFVDHYEALAVYQPIDVERLEPLHPAHGRREAPSVLPVAFAETLAEETFLARVLATIDDADRLGELASALVTLLNKVLAADLVDPGDLDAVQEASARARDTLSLGLEYVADGVVEAGADAVVRHGLTTLFRVGYSLTERLARRATALSAEDVDDPDLLPLLETRPLFPRALDVPPFAGARPFRSRADVARVEARLAEIAR